MMRSSKIFLIFLLTVGFIAVVGPTPHLMASSSQSHATHFFSDKGPHILLDEIGCYTCHADGRLQCQVAPAFADGTEEVPVFLETTTVCDPCHSEGGAYDGVQMAKANWEHGVYVTIPEWQPVTEYEAGDLVKVQSGEYVNLYVCIADYPFYSGSSFDETNWEFIYKMGSGSEALQLGKGQWCVTCHDGDVADEDNLPANSKADGSGVWAPNVDLYYTSGHGRPGADVECLGCHDASFAHIDGEPRTYDVDDSYLPATVINEYVDSYRLNANLDVPRSADEPGQYELCIQCHTHVWGNESNFRFDTTPIALLHGEHMAFDMPVWDSNVNGGEIFGIWREDSAMTCPTCHNVHGTQMNLLNDPLPPDPCRVMIRDGKLTEEPGLQLGLYFHWYTEQYGEVGSGQLTPDLPATRSGQMLCRPPFCANQHCHGAYPFYNREPPPVTTTIISESFEGADYEEAWTENIGTGCTLDEDYSPIPGTPPVDFGSQCLQSVSASSGYKARADLAYSSEQANTHTTFYVYVESEDLANSEFKNIGAWLDGSGNSVAVLRLFQGSSGNLRIRLRFYNNSGYGNYDSAAISLDTWYKVEFRYDYTNSTWEYKIDGTTKGSGSLTGAHRTGVKQWRLGFWQSSQAETGVIYLDELTAESFEYL